MANLKQADRLMQFTSPLGRDVLLIESLDGAEAISRLFEFHAELFATVETEIDPKSLVGAKVSVAITLNDAQGSRWVNGIIASFEQGASDKEFDVYQARIVPSLWQLTLSANCRVFQNMTAMDIVKKVIGEYGLTLSDQTTFAYKPLDYCTQYDESDFQFISRILEQFGIFYWFEHSEFDNKILFGDARSAYADCALAASFPFRSQAGGREGSYGAVISEFIATATMVPGKHTTRDYDLRPYAVHDIASKSSGSPFGNNAYERFLYPAGEEGYVVETGKELSSPDHGTLFLESEALASDAVAEVFRGTSNARSLTSGFTFTMTKSTRAAWNRKYLLREVTHQATQVPPYRSDGATGGGYSNRFTAVSSDIVYKPARTTLKPRIYGPQTAVVVAPSGEDMYLDKLGRVCVQFFWDRFRKPNTIDNTWVRVAQPWAGNGWGTFFWPRLQDEVVVQFLDGDPDNPVVIGSLYNGVNVPKYALPDHSTMTGIVTRSSKGGTAANANELRFEDKKGAEEIFINAEKNMNIVVEHANTRSVGATESISVKSARSLSVGGGQTTTIGGEHHVTVKDKHKEMHNNDTHMTYNGDLRESILNDHSLAAQNSIQSYRANYSLNAFGIYQEGGTIILKANDTICLRGPGGFISIGPAGITVQGTLVSINSGGAPIDSPLMITKDVETP